MDQVLGGEIRAYEIEKRYLRTDGSIVWASVSVSLVRDRDGAPQHFIAQIQDISERKRRVLELRHLSEHDPLTGLANRGALRAEITRQLAMQARDGGDLALLMLDLDHFKYLNDTIGHTAGDTVICAVARGGEPQDARADTVAHLGGDEFAVLLPTAGLDAGEEIAQSLLATLGALHLEVAGSLSMSRPRSGRRRRPGSGTR